MFFYIDWLYIVLVLPAVIFAIIASARVNSTFKKYSGTFSSSGLTGAQVARKILDINGLYDVRIEQVSGSLTDHFDPRTRVIRLSDTTYNSLSTAAHGVAAHEVGHAIQHSTGYIPIKIRQAIIPITNIGSRLAMPLIIVGIFLSIFGEYFAWIAYTGVICFAVCVLFQLVTLPVEFNASKRALRALENNHILVGSEIVGAKKVLNAAAMTYVASLAVSLTQLLRLVLLVLGTRRRR